MFGAPSTKQKPMFGRPTKVESSSHIFDQNYEIRKKRKKDINKIVVLLLACLCDQIGDILYLFTNWNTFGSQGLKTGSIFFIVFPFALNFFMSLYLLNVSRGIKNADACGKIMFCCCCWWIPSVLLITLLLWTKILDLFDYLQLTNAMFDQNIVRIKQIIKYSAYFQLFLEDLPQIIIQSVNNNIKNSWQIIQYFSMASSVVMIIVGIALFLFTIDKQDEQQ